MSGAALPPVIPEPFANHADPAFINTIPDTTGVAGRASYNLGFPPLTMQPVAAGGKPPFGQDVNGILFALSAHDFYVQAGQLFLYSSAVSTALGGYAIGTILGSTDLKTVWFNTTDANTTDPDGGSAVGWVSLFSSGFQPFAGLTGGTLTLTATQAARKVITLSGVLTANLAVVMPTWTAPAGRWLFINNTTGTFNVTVRTAGGTGVSIPQGGPSNPIEVYGDGTNIYPAVSPLGVPIDQAATPLTLVERTNTGNVNAVFFHTTAPTEAAGGIDNVYCEGSGPDHDGLIRKFSIAYFESVLSLSALGGQVTAAQVPLSAVIQYAANILASAALTGTPTTPTAAIGTSTTQVASTAFVNPSSNLVSNGSRKNPDGSIDQWFSAAYSGSGGTFVVNFPTPFTTAVFECNANTSIGGYQPGIQSFTLSAVTLNMTNLTGTPQTIWLRAIGK